MARSESLDEVRAYYDSIFPFYEKESVARAHLDFWRGLARQWRPARILEIGAGFGRITRALARYAPAIGIDISLPMLVHAARQCPSSSRARYVAADMRRLSFPCCFDLIVAPSDPFSHLLTAAERRQTLCRVAKLLSPSGRFVLEGLYRRARQPEARERRFRHADGVLTISESWQPVGRGQLWKATYRYLDRGRNRPDRAVKFSFTARAWEPSKLRRLFRSCGLKIENLWGDLEQRPFSGQVRRVVVVASRLRRNDL
jgi:SAM-dependent methyltransferase